MATAPLPPLRTSPPAAVRAAVAVADLNGDGKLDLAVANNGSNNVSVLLGNGNGTFAAAQNFITGTEPRSVAVADLNGDGKPDLAVASYGDGTVSVLLGNGNGTFRPPRTSPPAAARARWPSPTSTATASSTWPWPTPAAIR